MRCVVLAMVLGLCLSAAEPVGTESKRLTKYAEQWENRLGITGWHTKVLLVDRNQLGCMNGPCLAHSHFDARTHEFTISVLRETEYRDMELPPTEEIPGRDQTEISVVHEVVHLLLFPVKRKTFYSDADKFWFGQDEEKVVVALTRTLLTQH